MRIRGVLIFLVIILSGISLGLPDVAGLLPVNTLAADMEVKSAAELEEIIVSTIREAKESVTLRIADYDEATYDVSSIFRRVLEENAGLGFVESCNTSIKTSLGRPGAILELKLNYNYPADKVIAMRAETELKAEEIIAKLIKPGMNEYEKVLAVHDYVIRNSIYDRDNANKATVPPEEHEAYGVLVNGIGVCDSYAKAVKLLLDKSGVQCRIVEGTGIVSQGLDGEHAWNIVRIDGEYYHLDATWNDISDEKDSEVVAYHYLNLNDTQLQKSHVWDRSKYPRCTGTRYNYYVYNDLCAGSYREAYSRLVKAVSGRKEKLLLKIVDYKAGEYDIEEMLRKAARQSKLRNGISAKWIINDIHGILDIEFKY